MVDIQEVSLSNPSFARHIRLLTFEVPFTGKWSPNIVTAKPYGIMSSCRSSRTISDILFENAISSRDPSPTQDYARVKIGDVGFVHRGQFYLIFSAGSQLGERRLLGRDVPDTFEPLNVRTPVSGEPRKPDCLRTPTVRPIGIEIAAAEFKVYSPVRPIPWTILRFLF